MCTPDLKAGGGDAMSPQERLRYKEAMNPTVAPTTTSVTPQSSLSIPSNYIALPNGKRVSPEDYSKLQAKLKSRG